jgi:hypothetical protein
MKISEQCLARFNINKTDCARRFITMDETWIHHYNPEYKSSQNSGQKPVVQRQRRQGRFHQQERSWHRCFGMLKAFFIDYLEKSKTITGEYYSSLLTRLDEKIREKRPGLQKKKIIFHQDIAPAHKSVLAMEKLRVLQMNCFKIYPVSQMWLPLTSISSQNSNSFRWSAFFFELIGDCSCRGVFCTS